MSPSTFTPRHVIGSSDVSATDATPLEVPAVQRPVAPSFAPPTQPSVASSAVLPFERYVYVSAMLVVQGNTEQNLARAGIDAQTWQLTIASYNARFAVDPQLEARFREKLRHALGHGR